MEEDQEQVVIKNLKSLDSYLSGQDNSQNSVYVSTIPQVCKDLPCVLGIDEAGRGPVLGPMVYGTAFCPVNAVAHLETIECADSKALTEEKRDAIFEKICDSSASIGWAVEIISPNCICNSMLSRSKYSLNQVSMDSAIGLIKAAISGGVKIAHIYVDTVAHPEKYQAYLLSIFPDYEITVAKKADSTYPIVSAASICAKVTRDHSLSVWTFQEGIDLTPKDFGSGYPSDPLTKQFMIGHCDPVFGYPQLVRFSWSTASSILQSAAYHVEWDAVEDEPKTSSNNASITSFFKMTKQKATKKIWHEFFSKRHLTSTTDL